MNIPPPCTTIYTSSANGTLVLPKPELPVLKSLFREVILFIVLTLTSCLFFTASAQVAPPPVAVRGQLDLTGWDFAKDGSVNLNGEWAFYWKQLLEPEDLKSKSLPAMTDFFNVPGFWKGYDNHGSKLKGAGFATFHLKVRLNQGDHPWLSGWKIRQQHTGFG